MLISRFGLFLVVILGFEQACDAEFSLQSADSHEQKEEPILDFSFLELASYQTPVLNMSSNTPQVTTEQFELSGINQPSSITLGNSFTADPEFSNGIRILGKNVALRIGGYVKADLIKDFNAIDSTDSFDTTKIPTFGPQRENSRFHARQSRLSFDTRWMVGCNVARAFIEGDFFGVGAGGSSAFRLRHAFGTLGRLTAGHTWTTFTDPSAVPQTLDFEGAVSNVNRRQGLIRLTQPVMGDLLTFAVAIEDPNVTVIAPEDIEGEARGESPDFVARLRLDLDWGEFQSAMVIRELGFQPLNQSVISETAWGFNFTGSLLYRKRTKSYYQITFGEGIGSYRGSPDIVPTGPNTAAVVPMFGWMLGVKQEWNDYLSSNFTYSKLSTGDIPGQNLDNLSSTTYLAINLIAYPYDRVFAGVEYLHGIREDVSGAQGSANRLQMSFGFYLP